LRIAGAFRLQSQQESEMTNQDNGAPAPPEAPHGERRGGGRGVLIVLALAAGLAVGVLSTALAEGYGWHPGFMGGGGWHHGLMGWHHGGFMGGRLNPAQIDQRIDRMSKHMAIELDATPNQQAKVAGVAKSAVHDLLPLREKAQAARGRAVALLTAPTVDREAIEQLRADQLGLAETASKRIAQALADVSDALTPDQRKKIGDWIERWHHD
jgi:periplasmic protein CpxP/Spy